MKFCATILTTALFLVVSLFNLNISASTHTGVLDLKSLIIAENHDDMAIEQYEDMDKNEDTDEAEEDIFEDTQQEDADSQAEYEMEDEEENDEDLPSDSGLTEQEESQGMESGKMPAQCSTAAGHIIILLDRNGVRNGISYIQPEAEVEFSNQSGETHQITISPSGFVDKDSFKIPPHGSVSVKADSPLYVTTGKATVTTNGTHTKYFLVICP